MSVFCSFHSRNKHDAKTQICHICGKGFGADILLKAHLISHEKYLYECDLCPKKFKSKNVIQTHIKR